MVPKFASGEPKVLPCRIGDMMVCLDASRVESVEPSSCVQRNPAAGHPHGWLLNRSDETEIHDLADRIGAAGSSGVAAGEAAVVVTRTGGGASGILVDRVFEERRVTPEDWLAVPSWILDQWAGLFTGAVRAGDALWPYLRADRLHPEARLEAPRADETSRADDRGPPQVMTPGGNSQPGRVFLFSPPSPAAEPVVYCLSIRQIVELHEMPPLNRVPTSSDVVRGLCCYRGQALPLVDLGRWLGFGETAFDGEAQLLVVRGTPALPRIGFAIAKSTQVMSLPMPSQSLDPEPGLAPRVRGVFDIDGLTLIVPDIDAIPASG